MQDITISLLDDLFEADGQPMTDSRKVAARFGKRHSDVLRSIRAIKSEQPDFYQRNFAEVIDSYPNGKGGMQTRTLTSSPP